MTKTITGLCSGQTESDRMVVVEDHTAADCMVVAEGHTADHKVAVEDHTADHKEVAGDHTADRRTVADFVGHQDILARGHTDW